MVTKDVSKSSERSKKSDHKASSGRKRDRSLTEDRLIKAGTDVFSKYGFDAATTKMISKKSSVNESLIMRYFGGKEGLLVEIIRRFFEEIHATPLSYPAQETLESELIQFCQHLFRMSRQHTSIFKIMLLRASIDPKMKKKVISFINADGDPRLIERIELLKSKKQIPAGLDPQLIHTIAFQSISAIFLSEILFDTQKQDQIEAHLEILISHTVRGLFLK